MHKHRSRSPCLCSGREIPQHTLPIPEGKTGRLLVGTLPPTARFQVPEAVPGHESRPLALNAEARHLRGAPGAGEPGLAPRRIRSAGPRRGTGLGGCEAQSRQSQ